MKRLSSEGEIIALIDRFRRERDELLDEASYFNYVADSLRNTKWSQHIRKFREDAELATKRCRWREARLETLKRKLAEFRTGELKGCETDGSVTSS